MVAPNDASSSGRHGFDAHPSSDGGIESGRFVTSNATLPKILDPPTSMKPPMHQHQGGFPPPRMPPGVMYRPPFGPPMQHPMGFGGPGMSFNPAMLPGYGGRGMPPNYGPPGPGDRFNIYQQGFNQVRMACTPFMQAPMNRQMQPNANTLPNPPPSTSGVQADASNNTLRRPSIGGSNPLTPSSGLNSNSVPQGSQGVPFPASNGPGGLSPVMPVQKQGGFPPMNGVPPFMFDPRRFLPPGAHYGAYGPSGVSMPPSGPPPGLSMMLNHPNGTMCQPALGLLQGAGMVRTFLPTEMEALPAHGFNSAGMRTTTLKCPPSQMRNGRPMLMELLYMCNTIFASSNLSEHPITPVTPLKLAAGIKRIFCRANSIRAVPFETISPLYRLLGIQELKWLPSRVAYPRPSDEEITYTTKGGDQETLSFPSFQPPPIGRASKFVRGPIQVPENLKVPGFPLDISDVRWRFPLWSFYSHITHDDAAPVALAILSCLDDVAFSRLRATSSESRKWLDYWYYSWNLDNEKQTCTKSRTSITSPESLLMASNILKCRDYGSRIPRLVMADLEIFEKIKSVGGSKATQSTFVQQFKAPSANFIRMCLASIEPGGVFSVVPCEASGQSSSSSSSAVTENSTGQAGQVSQNRGTTQANGNASENNSKAAPPILSVSDDTLEVIRKAVELYPDLSIERVCFDSWQPKSASGEYALRLYNCWRQAINRVVSVHRRSIFELWYTHDKKHFKRERSQTKLENKCQDGTNDDIPMNADLSGLGPDTAINRDSVGSNTAPPDAAISTEPSVPCCMYEDSPSLLGRTYVDWNAADPEDLQESTADASYLVMQANRRTDCKKRSDRRADVDLDKCSFEHALSNLFKHLCEDLIAPYARPNAPPSEMRKDCLASSIAAHIQRVEWDIICLLSLYIQGVQQTSETSDSVKDRLATMIRQMKADRLMLLTIQGRMNSTRNIIKEEFDPEQHSVRELVMGLTLRPSVRRPVSGESNTNADNRQSNSKVSENSSRKKRGRAASHHISKTLPLHVDANGVVSFKMWLARQKKIPRTPKNEVKRRKASYSGE